MLKSTRLFTESCNNTTHKESAKKGKYKLTKKQMKTKKRNERRKYQASPLQTTMGIL